jgi:hypothetical protein
MSIKDWRDIIKKKRGEPKLTKVIDELKRFRQFEEAESIRLKILILFNTFFKLPKDKLK